MVIYKIFRCIDKLGYVYCIWILIKKNNKCKNKIIVFNNKNV